MMSTFKTAAALVLVSTFALPGCASLKERAVEIEAKSETNPGPCPRTFALYEASRMVEFRGTEKFANVGFTAEIDKTRSLCRYYAAAPIEADLEIDMRFGRGPAAAAEASYTYNYFVAVTRKNIEVIEKQYFPLTVTFPPGVSEMAATERLDSIIIPRAKETTSGANFEIIVGFDVTPQQAEFNAAGKRFRVSVGQ